MTVANLIILLLRECKGDTNLSIMIDKSIPVLFNKKFSIKRDKGFILFKGRLEKGRDVKHS